MGIGQGCMDGVYPGIMYFYIFSLDWVSLGRFSGLARFSDDDCNT
jgi:hypothetical protein